MNRLDVVQRYDQDQVSFMCVENVKHRQVLSKHTTDISVNVYLLHFLTFKMTYKKLIASK